MKNNKVLKLIVIELVLTFIIASNAITSLGCEASPYVTEYESCLTLDSPDTRSISMLEECQYNDAGPWGVCLPIALMPDLQDRLAKCDNGGMCVPKKQARYGMRLIPQKCLSFLGLEGRCQSLLIPEIKEQEAFFPQDICPDDELCQPCYDPITGEDTRACTLAPSICDTPEEEPYVLECPYNGPPLVNVENLPDCDCPDTHCIPPSRVPDKLFSMFDECEQGYCVPDKMIESAFSFLQAACRTPEGWEGRCLSECLPPIRELDFDLYQVDCPGGELCAPCFHPLTGRETMFCSVSQCDLAE